MFKCDFFFFVVEMDFLALMNSSVNSLGYIYNKDISMPYLI